MISLPIRGRVRCLRYAQLKCSYDPDNVFRNNHNILPASGP
jgi:hypothetical protein